MGWMLGHVCHNLDSCRVGMPDGKCGQLFHAYNFGVALPIPLQTGLSLLSCSHRVQGLVSQVVQLVGIRDNSPILRTVGPAFPSTPVIDVVGGFFSSFMLSHDR